MTKQEFLKELGESLLQEVSQTEYTDSMQYYENYIDESMGNGQNESEIIQSLGSPRLIAKTIAEARQGAAATGTYYQEENGEEGHFEKGKVPFMNRFQLDTWYGKVVAVLVAIVVVMLVLSLLGLVVSFAWNVVLPIVVVVWLISFFVKKIKGR